MGGRERVGDGRTEPAAGPGDQRGRHAATATLPGDAAPAGRMIEAMAPDPSFSPTQLAARAAYLLRGNDLGVMTTAAPLLYPHMWSWDAAFVAVGLAPLSVERAVVELDTLLSAQWANGMIPHIVFANKVDGYFPGPARWACSALAADAPRDRHTSGITQPPVHAIAVERILDHARRRGRSTRQVAEAFLDRRWARPGPLAPMARRGTRPAWPRPHHAVSRLGIRHGQLAAVGRGVRQRGARCGAGIPAQRQHDRDGPVAAARPTASTTATCGCSRR